MTADLRAYLEKTLDNIEDETRGWAIADVRELITDALALEAASTPTEPGTTEEPTVTKAGDWLYVRDEDGTIIGSSIVGYGPNAPAPVYVAAALLAAVTNQEQVSST